MHVQSVQKYCFSLSNMQICGVFVAVVVVVNYQFHVLYPGLFSSVFKKTISCYNRSNAILDDTLHKEKAEKKAQNSPCETTVLKMSLPMSFPPALQRHGQPRMCTLSKQ